MRKIARSWWKIKISYKKRFLSFERYMLYYDMLNLLFICSRNKLRSPTAEKVFSTYQNVETDSAGIATDAECIVLYEQVQNADIVFTMERKHTVYIKKNFKMKNKRIICLDIKDNYEYMDPKLILLLERKVTPLLKL